MDDFNIFVGQNNHGKTNFFEALRWFFSEKGEALEDIRFMRKPENEVTVEVEFSGAQDAAERIKSETSKTKIKAKIGAADTVVIRRSTLGDYKKRVLLIDGNEIDPGTGFDAALNDFLPNFEYVDTRKFVDEVASYTKTSPIGKMLSGVLSVMLEKDEQYRAFKDKFDELFGNEDSTIRVELDSLSGKIKVHLQKQFPECTTVEFNISEPTFEDLLKHFTTTVDDGIATSVEEKGDGMQRAVMLAIIQAYAQFRKENEEAGKSFLFVIDEAELHLHPTGQRLLKNALLEIANNGDQVLLSTHSSVLVVDEHVNQRTFKVEKINCLTHISRVTEGQKQNIVYELLGGTPADLLLPKNFLIVEGKTESDLLARVIERHYPEFDFQIIPADGNLKRSTRTLNGVNTAYKALDVSIYRDKTVILCDKPDEDRFLLEFLAGHLHLKKDQHVFVLPFQQIECVYPDTWKKTEEEAAAMTGDEKVALAKTVAEGITKADFESEMVTVFNALKSCKSLSF